MKMFWNAFLCLLVGTLLTGCGRHSANSFQGYIEGEYVYVASPLGGALTNLAVARGNTVKTGQLLFQLDRQPEGDSLKQAKENLAAAQAHLTDLTKGQRPTEITALQAQLAGAEANLKLADIQYARRKRLGGEDVVSKEELDTMRAQRDDRQAFVKQLKADLATAQLGSRTDVIAAAQADVKAQQAALAKAQWSYDQKQQYAPTNAVVQDTLYRPGEWVSAGSPVVVLLPPANLRVRFFVPETELPQIKLGQRVTVHCDGAARLFHATVNFISTQAEYTPPVIYSQKTRANLVYMIEAVFAPADAAQLRPGQPADVTLN